ncbi:MAG: cadherin-like domain-containing protein, partial [Gemmataceae bacterium]
MNDAPHAFNDAFILGRNGSQVIAGGNLLSNDFDVDVLQTPGPGSDTLSVVSQTISLGTGGSVALNTDGTFEWTCPTTFDGVAAFTYTMREAAGLTSTATVRLKALLPEPVIGGDPPPSLVVNDDVYHVGNKDLSISAADGVLANDPSGTFAVLVSHPTLGQLTSFGFDGSFGIHPGVQASGVGFGYRVFRNDMLISQPAGATMNDLGVDIYHGINPIKLIRKVQKTPGAFTTANLNDSDYDGTRDDQDNDVSPRVNATAGYR